MSAGLPVDTRSGYFKSADGGALLRFVRARHNPFDIEADKAFLKGCGMCGHPARCQPLAWMA